MTVNLSDKGIQKIVNYFDLFFIDIWGVLHNGIKLNMDAVNVLSELDNLGKQYVLLTNAPRPNSDVVKKSSEYTSVDLTNDPEFAVKNADVVMTDTFTSIHTSDPKRNEKFLPAFQVNDSLMERAKNDAIFMHCLPAKREQEVTSSVIDGPQSVVWDEAENRLHSQKALLLSLLGI